MYSSLTFVQMTKIVAMGAIGCVIMFLLISLFIGAIYDMIYPFIKKDSDKNIEKDDKDVENGG